MESFSKKPILDDQVLENSEEKSQLSSSINKIVTNLPKRNGWTSLFEVYQYQGFWYTLPFLSSVIKAQQQFKPQPNDIIISSYPKTGVTWLKALTFSIVTRSRFNLSTNPLQFKVPHDCIPFMEFDLVEDSKNRDLKIPLVSTHIPYNSLPEPVISSACKIVYICRDPKDVFVSSWYFYCDVLGVSLPLKEAFDLFCEGVSSHGPFWDHVLGYLKASKESPNEVMFLKYEELKNDTPFYVRKLAEFMGCSFSFEEEEKGVVQNIIELCSFERLSKLDVNLTGKHRETSMFVVDNKMFFRKGKVGDWMNHLDDEMVRRLDQITEYKLGGYGSQIMNT